MKRTEKLNMWEVSITMISFQRWIKFLSRVVFLNTFSFLKKISYLMGKYMLYKSDI